MDLTPNTSVDAYQMVRGVLLFFYNTEMDTSCIRDNWFKGLESAYEYISEEFGIPQQDWEQIPNPLSNSQNDFIQPVRVRGRDTGSPEWGYFEKLADGKWVDYFP